MQNPPLTATPFAEIGDKNIIPDAGASAPQLATMQAGFPARTQQPIALGGIPPERADFNGILNLYGQHIVFQNKGGRYAFDATFAEQIGGYEEGARLTLTDGTDVVSSINANTNNPNIDMTGWIRPAVYAFAVIDSSGKNQQQINSSYPSILFSGASTYANFATAIDASPFISSYINALPDGSTVYIPKGNYAIKSLCTITSQVNIVCDGTLVVSGDSTSAIDFRQAPSYTLTGADLSQLPKRGDTKLFLTNTSLFDSANYHFSIHSTEVEIVRIGDPNLYAKNETLDFVDSNFNVRGQFDLTYTDASKITILVYKRRIPVRIELDLDFIPNAGQTTGARILEAHGVNHITWNTRISREKSKGVAGISFGYYDSVVFTFTQGCDIQGGQADTGDSYAFLNITSSYITHNGLSYRDQGVTTKRERGYAARHGKYVTFRDCFINGLDDHYGHHYVIDNCDFLHRGIVYCGGPLTVTNCRQHALTASLVELRTDTPYADGDLIIRDSFANAILLGLTSANNSAYSTKYKAWDNILIDNCEVNQGASHVMNIGSMYAHNTNFRTNSFTIRNLRYKKSPTSTSLLISSGAQSDFVDNFTIDGLYSVDGNTTNSRSVFAVLASKSITLRNIPEGIDGSWLADTIVFDNIKIGYAVASPMTIVGRSSVDIRSCVISNDVSSYASSNAQGSMTITGSKINTGKFFSNAQLSASLIGAYGNLVTTNPNFSADLTNYTRNKVYRFATTSYSQPALALGAATAISNSSLTGVAMGDIVESSIVENALGLEVKAWVDAVNHIQWYITNPPNNPLGAATARTINIRFTIINN